MAHMRATAIAAILFAPLISGCGGSTTTTPSPAVTGYDGTWTGQTSQSQPITFTVGGNQIVQVGFSYTTLGPACSGQGGFAGGGASLFATPVISNSTFSLMFVNVHSDALTWSMTGAFSTLTHAQGTLQVTFTPPTPPAGIIQRCGAVQATWTAQRGS
jgi:hypothetical protein